VRDPIYALAPITRRRLWFGTLILTFVLTVVLSGLDGPLRERGYGIVAFELAGTAREAQAIVAAWAGEPRVYAGLVLGLDYLYMPAYSTTIACFCSWASRQRRETWRTAGVWLVWAQWAAAAFDALENVGCIEVLFGSTSRLWPPLTAICATMKFSLVALGLLYSIVGMFVARRKHEQPYRVRPT
jgi:hypothetical protein